MDRYFSDKALKLGRRERTRSALIDGAIKIIAEKGFDGVSIKEITHAAGLANGTFYNHYTDVTSLSRDAAISVAIEIVHEIDDETKILKDGLDKIIVSTDKMVNRTVDSPNWGKVLIGAWHSLENFDQEVVQIMKNDLKSAKRQGLVKVTVNQILEYQLIALIVLSISLQIKSGRNKTIRLSTAEAILRLLGVSAEDAKEKAQKALFA